MNDEELIEYTARGDTKAFQELYLRYHRKIFDLCYHYLQHKEEAEEALQDVFLSVHRKAHKYQGKSSAGTWLYRVAVNKCLDMLRYKNARKRLAVITHLFEEKAAEEETPLYLDDQVRQLYKAINTLPASQRSAVILTQIQKLSINDAAAIMNKTPKAVESLLQRGKSGLKKILDKTEGFSG